MLLTKRLSAFLSQNTTPQLHTLILLSPTGKLLSSSSTSSSSVLRTQATLAVSLWNLYHPFSTNTSELITSALPSFIQSSTDAHELGAITIQLEYGIMCIRSLSSGLLFVAIGPSSTPSPNPQHRIPLSANTSAPGSPGVNEMGHHGSQVSLHGHDGLLGGPASEAGSIGSERGAQASIWGVRRRAAEVGQALEGKLEGFVLSGEGR
jgi:hypothetical protein